MKEATGELSTTVIAVVAIAGIAALFSTLLLPYLTSSIQAKMYCSDAICESCDKTEKTCKCTYQKYKDGVADGDPKELQCNNPQYEG